MFELAVILLIASFGGVLLAMVVAAITAEAATATDRGMAQLVLALVGLLVASGAFLASKLRRGRPGLWLCATGLVWAVWLALLASL